MASGIVRGSQTKAEAQAELRELRLLVGQGLQPPAGGFTVAATVGAEGGRETVGLVEFFTVVGGR